tara:strand:- start:199 stop:393 length:195 start_codon:yes stop_codon:yes gene_type:complete
MNVVIGLTAMIPTNSFSTPKRDTNILPSKSDKEILTTVGSFTKLQKGPQYCFNSTSLLLIGNHV